MENKTKILSFWGKLTEILINFSKQWVFIFSILIAVLISVSYIYLNWPHFSIKSNSLFNDFIEPVISILTFITALLIGFYNIYTNWLNTLEKRLTVFFVYYYESKKAIDEELSNLKQTLGKLKTEIDIQSHEDNTQVSLETKLKKERALEEKDKKEKEILKREKEINFIEANNLSEETPYCLMVCEEALLAHEGDMRNWAQQLGWQLEGGNLSFHPFFTLGKNNAVTRIEKLCFRQYTLFVFLNKIPNCIINSAKGICSTDNYDDKPTSKKIPFSVKEINYKGLLEYNKAKDYIKSLI